MLPARDEPHRGRNNEGAVPKRLPVGESEAAFKMSIDSQVSKARLGRPGQGGIIVPICEAKEPPADRLLGDFTFSFQIGFPSTPLVT